MTLDDVASASNARIEKIFSLYLNQSEPIAEKLQHAMTYSLVNGGKRIRPLLVYLSGIALNAAWENLDAAAAAIEIIHTYSLIHDDLPAMDNADLRRGKPSCHKAFDEATAILAGDALQPLAFEIIATHPSTLNAQQRLDMITVLCHASGLNGMTAGQTLDLAGVDSLSSLTTMYELKTGALLSACVKLGAIAAGVENQPTRNALDTFAQNIGLAFQIQDDLLDLEGTEVTTGKTVGLDVINQKITYPALLGINTSREKVDALFESALESIAFLDKDAQLLSEFARFLLRRKN